MKKRVFSAILACSIIAASTIGIFAASTPIVKTLIDSNSWTFMASAEKDSTTTKASIYIETMYDADGIEAHNYKRLWVRLGENGEQGAPVVALKGVTVDIPLQADAQAAGTTLEFYGMGYNPALDCYVDGNANAN